MYPMRSRFTFGAADWTTSLTSRPWTPVDETVGGRRISAAGIPATYVVQREVLVELPLRIEEDDWENLLALVAYGQTGQSFRWYPDSALTDEDYDSALVYLQSPAPGERFSPSRDGQYPRMFEATITLRGVSSSLPWTPYFNV